MRNYVFFQQDVTTPPPPPPPPPPISNTGSSFTEDKASNRAIWALVLGIAAWFLCGLFAGIPAWIMGKKEINEIEAGRSNPKGLTMAKIGMWLGLINTILGILAIFVLIILALAGVLMDR